MLKGGLGRITENTERYDGVVVFSMSDTPLVSTNPCTNQTTESNQSINLITQSIPQGFGVAAKSTAECRRMDPSGIVCIHQADVGEYLRIEDTLI